MLFRCFESRKSSQESLDSKRESNRKNKNSSRAREICDDDVQKIMS